MKLVTFTADGGLPRVGALTGESVIDLNVASGGRVPADILALLAGGEPMLTAAREAVSRVQEAGSAGGGTSRDGSDSVKQPGGAAAIKPLKSVRLLPPIPRPGKMLCLGLNYKDHIAETGKPTPIVPTLFPRFATSLIGPYDPMVLPRLSAMLDWEAELALVIGRGGRAISRERAMEHVAGCMIFNDGTLRDYQNHTTQWTPGKNFDGTGPSGPFLALLDEGYDPHDLDVRLWVNDELMQSTNTSQLIFDLPAVVEFASGIMTLEPGDVISTGTCGGVGHARNPQRFLKVGDRVSIEITALGRQENRVVAEL